jgi:hypothetical protein
MSLLLQLPAPMIGSGALVLVVLVLLIVPVFTIATVFVVVLVAAVRLAAIGRRRPTRRRSW